MKNITRVALIIFATMITFLGTIDAKQMKRAIVTQTASKPEIIPQVQEQTAAEIEEEIIEDTKELLATLPIVRSSKADIIGYSNEEKEEAQYNKEQLEEKEKVLNNLINKKKKNLEMVAIPGRLWGYSAQPGKEQEYETLNQELQTLQDLLTQVQNSIRDQMIVLGEKWSKKYTALGGTLALAAIGGTAYAVGPNTIKSGLTQFKEAPLQSIKSGSNLVSQKLYNYWQNLSFKNALGYENAPLTSTSVPEESGYLLGTVGTFAAGLAISEAKSEAKAYILNKTLGKLISYINDPEVDPTAKEDFKKQAIETEAELKVLKAKIARDKKLKEQIQRNTI